MQRSRLIGIAVFIVGIVLLTTGHLNAQPFGPHVDDAHAGPATTSAAWLALAGFVVLLVGARAVISSAPGARREPAPARDEGTFRHGSPAVFAPHSCG